MGSTQLDPYLGHYPGYEYDDDDNDDYDDNCWSSTSTQQFLLVISRGGSRAGVPGGQDPHTPPPPFWGTPKLHKEGKKTLCTCTRKHCVLVLNS